MRQNARTARLVTQLQTRTPPSTFCWSIHRWKDSSPLSILSAMRLRASPSIRDSANRFGSLEIWVSGLRATSTRGRRRYFEVDVTTRARDETRGRHQAAQTATRLLPFRFTRFIYHYPLSLACSVSARYLTSTSPTRHAPRCSRNFPSNTSSQAGDDVQCDVSEGYSGNVQKVYGKR